ncbi:hypothetical protein M501DRAFT_1000990 [Patellaria atrata CBS 101060]|uniref:Uncharacterized protein n=1 Tax=Patellaria atrata CBS 101060 TaxID=1346257 RepID=A0A9P4SFS9_9PEZI|nr:hypothetical protein M501DRAFT_1000990 [Patellaria atrata CBS 101060]
MSFFKRSSKEKEPSSSSNTNDGTAAPECTMDNSLLRPPSYEDTEPDKRRSRNSSPHSTHSYTNPEGSSSTGGNLTSRTLSKRPMPLSLAFLFDHQITVDSLSSFLILYFSIDLLHPVPKPDDLFAYLTPLELRGWVGLGRAISRGRDVESSGLMAACNQIGISAEHVSERVMRFSNRERMRRTESAALGTDNEAHEAIRNHLLIVKVLISRPRLGVGTSRLRERKVELNRRVDDLLSLWITPYLRYLSGESDQPYPNLPTNTLRQQRSRVMWEYFEMREIVRELPDIIYSGTEPPYCTGAFRPIDNAWGMPQPEPVTDSEADIQGLRQRNSVLTKRITELQTRINILNVGEPESAVGVDVAEPPPYER